MCDSVYCYTRDELRRTDDQRMPMYGGHRRRRAADECKDDECHIQEAVNRLNSDFGFRVRLRRAAAECKEGDEDCYIRHEVKRPVKTIRDKLRRTNDQRMPMYGGYRRRRAADECKDEECHIQEAVNRLNSDFGFRVRLRRDAAVCEAGDEGCDAGDELTASDVWPWRRRRRAAAAAE